MYKMAHEKIASEVKHIVVSGIVILILIVSRVGLLILREKRDFL